MARRSSPVLDPALKRVAAVVVLGSIMSILDTTIVTVALDTLGRDFKVSIDDIQWVTTGYLLALAVVIPATGWSIDRFGAKRMWLVSLVLFVGGSALCGLAWSAPALVAFRILQGLGGGMILPIGQSIVARAAGPQRMGRVMSVIGVPTVMGPVLGPVIGGLIVSHASWRWIFYVNVPIGVVALVLSWRFLEGGDHKVDHRLDALGLALLSPGLALLVYALSEVGTTGSLTSVEVLASFAVGMALMVAFAIHGWRKGEQGLVDLRLFRHRNFTVANVAVFLLGATLYGSMFLLPLYYQVVRGQSALMAGLLMAPQGIGAAAVMRTSGSITDRLGSRIVVLPGVVLLTVGTLAYTQVHAQTNEVLLAAALFVRGMGLGLAMMPMIAAAYQDLGSADVPRASTVINIMRQVGGSVATALVAVVLQRQITEQAHAPATATLAATAKVPPHVASELSVAFSHSFWWVVGLTALTIFPSLALPNRAPGLGGGEVEAAEPGPAVPVET